jgi:hypothetical protein
MKENRLDEIRLNTITNFTETYRKDLFYNEKLLIREITKKIKEDKKLGKLDNPNYKILMNFNSIIEYDLKDNLTH